MFGKHSGSLSIPPNAATDPRALEVLRIWAGASGQHIALRSEAWSDAAAWGLLLVDIARHVARAHQQVAGEDVGVTLARIREGFDAEWSHATDEPTGGLSA